MERVEKLRAELMNECSEWDLLDLEDFYYAIGFGVEMMQRMTDHKGSTESPKCKALIKKFCTLIVANIRSVLPVDRIKKEQEVRKKAWEKEEEERREAFLTKYGNGEMPVDEEDLPFTRC